MIRELVIAPIIGLFLIGFMLQMASIAQSTSEKVLNYADDMNAALDCAFVGRSIYDCSPSLLNYDFEEDARQYQRTNEDYLTTLKEIFNNATIIENNQTITIIID